LHKFISLRNCIYQSSPFLKRHNTVFVSWQGYPATDSELRKLFDGLDVRANNLTHCGFLHGRWVNFFFSRNPDKNCSTVPNAAVGLYWF